jgi:hypothetical protein
MFCKQAGFVVVALTFFCTSSTGADGLATSSSHSAKNPRVTVPVPTVKILEVERPSNVVEQDTSAPVSRQISSAGSPLDTATPAPCDSEADCSR